jgi:hypothetical protein
MKIKIIEGLSNMSVLERKCWLRLFEKSFRRNSADSNRSFLKYENHPSDCFFCIALDGEQIVASYSGIAFRVSGIRVFLSTDTMSNGEIKSATETLGKKLYEYLAKNDVDVVCGFPNEKGFFGHKRLGWKFEGGLRSYIGIPLIWRASLVTDDRSDVWCLKRPENGVFLEKPSWLTVYGREGLYHGWFCSIVFTLSAKPPGRWFVRVPDKLIPNKRFGFMVLCRDKNQVEVFIKSIIDKMDINAIDVP